MTLASRRYDVFRRLGVKLLIEDEEAKGFPPLVARLIMPVVDVSSLLLSEDALFANGNLDVAAGAFIAYHTVPTGERWHMRWYNREVATGATHVEFHKIIPNLLFQLTVNTVNAQFGSFDGIILDEGDRLGLISTDDVNDGSISLSVAFGRELLS